MRYQAFVLAYILGAAMGWPWCPTNGEINALVPSDTKYGTMKAVHDELVKCADKVHTLNLRVRLHGCSDWPDRWSFPLNPRGGDRYPNLTSLRIEGYQFDDREYPGRADFPPRDGIGTYIQQAFLWLTLPYERQNMTNLELWLEAMDWSKLQNLELVDGMSEQFVELVAPQLSNIRNLSVSPEYRSEKGPHLVKTFITSIPHAANLTSLTWSKGWKDGAFEEIGHIVGKTLVHLDIHTPEPWYGMPCTAMDAKHARVIGEQFPHLQSLSISLDRNGTWPWDNLKAISTFASSLRDLEIWLELSSDAFRGLDAGDMPPARDPEDDGFRLPRLTRDSAQELFDYLVENKEGEPFRRVRFYIGPWNRPWDGPIYLPAWVEDRRGLVDCTIDEAGHHECVHAVNGEGLPFHTGYYG